MPSSPAPGRAAAYAVVRRTFEQGAYTDRALHAATRTLDARDRAFAMRLAYGTVQRRATLDALIAQLAARPVSALDAPLLAALRLGVYELCFMDSAAHGAVNDAVELASASRGQGLANAVLRRVAREHTQLLAALDDSTPAGAATAYSLPLWIAELWWEQFGAATAKALMARANEPAESSLRANTLVTDAAALAAALPVRATVPGEPPEAVLLGEPFDTHGSQLWRDGALMAQSRAAMLVSHCVDPRPGERVLDLCAAPGGKSTHLAALMGGEGAVVAVERHTGRARALTQTIARMQAKNVTVEVADAAAPRADAGSFHRVLLDAPCSGLGTLASRPDLRWRVTPEAVHALAEQQARLLSAAAAALAPGGTLVYSTCTISPAENEQQIGDFLDQHPHLAAIDLSARFPAWAHPHGGPFLLALPHVQGSDGFFIAALRSGGEAR
jgi:16S rRNA (cytosine967-C5)-methyltransferase